MKETVSDFQRRTGVAYDPPDSVTRIARPLEGDGECPTLFRFPGPCVLLQQFGASLETLSPGAVLWAADAPVNSEARGAAHFGTLALLQPLRFAFAPGDPAGVWVGVSRPVDPAQMVWVPPSAFATAIPWDEIADSRQAAPFLGGGISRERDEIRKALDAYLEELLEVARVGIPEPQTRWCDRPREVRLLLLAEHGIRGPWSQAAPRIAG